MSNEVNLNEMLNTDEISNVIEENVSDLTTDIQEDIQPDGSGSVETPTAETEWISLYDYVRQYPSQFSNANLTNISGFTRVPDGKYLLFCTSHEDDADLILMDRPTTLWLEPQCVAESIAVFPSGLVIKGNGFRYYVGKNNVIKIEELDGINSDVKLISRAKNSDSVKVSSIGGDRSSADIDTIKLHAKRVSPRLYNAIHELNDRGSIKTAILEFMTRITDLNHLIKIEKEILYALTI